MSDRIPNAPGVAPPPREDTTARVVARILEAKPKVAVDNVGANGMVRFTLFYLPLGISQQDIRDMALLRRSLLSDFLGRFLILTNLDDFTPLLTECDYSHFVLYYPIQRVGLRFDDQRLIFEFNMALLHLLQNEELAKLIGGGTATVKWNWDFFRRFPQNP